MTLPQAVQQEPGQESQPTAGPRARQPCRDTVAMGAEDKASLELPHGLLFWTWRGEPPTLLNEWA